MDFFLPKKIAKNIVKTCRCSASILMPADAQEATALCGEKGTVYGTFSCLSDIEPAFHAKGLPLGMHGEGCLVGFTAIRTEARWVQEALPGFPEEELREAAFLDLCAEEHSFCRSGMAQILLQLADSRLCHDFRAIYTRVSLHDVQSLNLFFSAHYLLTGIASSSSEPAHLVLKKNYAGDAMLDLADTHLVPLNALKALQEFLKAGYAACSVHTRFFRHHLLLARKLP